jgi:hypothetical protein
VTLAVFTGDSDKLVLQCLEPFVRSNHRLQVRLEYPTVLYILGVGDLVANPHRSLERRPAAVSASDCQWLAKPRRGCFINDLDLIEYLQVAKFLTGDRPLIAEAWRRIGTADLCRGTQKRTAPAE